MKKIFMLLALFAMTALATVPTNKINTTTIDRSVSHVEEITVERTAVGWQAMVEGYDSYGNYRYGESWGQSSRARAERVAMAGYYTVGGVKSRIYNAISNYSTF